VATRSWGESCSWPSERRRQLYRCSDAGGGEILQRSPDRIVSIEEDGLVVRKSFVGPDQELTQWAAASEFSRLEQFAAALDRLEGATCPRPIELIMGPVPAIRMERVSGTPLLVLLRAEPLTGPLHDRLAAAASRALVAYIDAVGEPYHDFQFDNMLYDAGSRSVVLVDFGLPDHGTVAVDDALPVASSLGNLIGSTIFQSARPKWLLARRQHRQAIDLAATIVHRVLAMAAAETSLQALHQRADAAYRRCAFGGGRVRRGWYGTAGYVLARRLRVDGLTFSPGRPGSWAPA
jgi:hypothetical protein